MNLNNEIISHRRLISDSNEDEEISQESDEHLKRRDVPLKHPLGKHLLKAFYSDGDIVKHKSDSDEDNSNEDNKQDELLGALVEYLKKSEGFNIKDSGCRKNSNEKRAKEKRRQRNFQKMINIMKDFDFSEEQPRKSRKTKISKSSSHSKLNDDEIFTLEHILRDSLSHNDHGNLECTCRSCSRNKKSSHKSSPVIDELLSMMSSSTPSRRHTNNGKQIDLSTIFSTLPDESIVGKPEVNKKHNKTEESLTFDSIESDEVVEHKPFHFSRFRDDSESNESEQADEPKTTPDDTKRFKKASRNWGERNKGLFKIIDSIDFDGSFTSKPRKSRASTKENYFLAKPTESEIESNYSESESEADESEEYPRDDPPAESRVRKAAIHHRLKTRSDNSLEVVDSEEAARFMQLYQRFQSNIKNIFDNMGESTDEKPVEKAATKPPPKFISIEKSDEEILSSRNNFGNDNKSLKKNQGSNKRATNKAAISGDSDGDRPEKITIEQPNNKDEDSYLEYLEYLARSVPIDSKGIRIPLTLAKNDDGRVKLVLDRNYICRNCGRDGCKLRRKKSDRTKEF